MLPKNGYDAVGAVAYLILTGFFIYKYISTRGKNS